MRILSPGLIKKLSSDSAEGLLLLRGSASRIRHLLHVRLEDRPWPSLRSPASINGSQQLAKLARLGMTDFQIEGPTIYSRTSSFKIGASQACPTRSGSRWATHRLRIRRHNAVAATGNRTHCQRPQHSLQTNRRVFRGDPQRTSGRSTARVSATTLGSRDVALPAVEAG